MKKWLVATVAVLFLSLPVAADDSRPRREYVETRTTALITDTAINDACVADAWDDDTPTCTSFVEVVLGRQQAEMYVKFVRGGTATDVYVQCEGSQTGLKPWAEFQGGDSSMLPTYIDMSPKKLHWDVSAYGVTLDDTNVWRVSLKLNDYALRCRFWADGATADDKVSVWITYGAP